jgi:hypothetical protein
MKTKMNFISFVILLLISQSGFGAEKRTSSAEIQTNLEMFSSYAQPHKVYLHMDKSEYKTGETIWFKAYLLDGASHRLSSDTSNIYIELIHSGGISMEVRILLTNDGVANGEIFLADDLPDGNYVIRAFTDWMQNFGEEYYFTRYLYINNPGYENVIRRWDVFRNRLFNYRLRRIRGDFQEASFPVRAIDSFLEIFRSSKLQVAFFPEGGHIIEGFSNRVAVKIVDVLGQGQDAEGEIIDSDGETVSSFKTEFGGIGVFEIEPERGKTYRAHISINGGRYQKYDLPEVMSKGYALRIDQEANQVKVTVMSAVRPGSSSNSQEIFLMGHTRGEAHFGKALQLVNGIEEVIIDKGSFPAGIAHFTVFTSDYEPVSERLVFIDHGDALTFSPQVRADGAGSPGYIDMEVTIRDGQGNPAEGSFSLSAITGMPFNDEFESNIVSYILLSSDLKGITKNSLQYFGTLNDSNVIIDNLLLTHGWRRFDWDDVLSGEFTKEERPDRVPGLAIRGRLRDPAKDETLRNYPVYLRIADKDTFSTKTERNGRFAFTGLYYEGKVKIELSSYRLAQNYPPKIELNAWEGRPYDYELGVQTREKNITSRGMTGAVEENQDRG